MGHLIRMWDDKKLLFDLRLKTIQIIHCSEEIKIIRGMVESYEILDLTIDIQQRFPTEFPEIPEYDRGAINQLSELAAELFVSFHPILPQPIFDAYSVGIRKLAHSFQSIA